MIRAAFGSWPSPISASLVSSGGVGLGGPAVRGDEVWWSELRPSDGGRVALVRSVTRDGSLVTTDMIDAPFSARTKVHEYGGGAWFLGADHLYFSNWDDQRLYRVTLTSEGAGQTPTAITPEPQSVGAWRYADGRETPDGAWVISVREDHHGVHAHTDGVAHSAEAKNTLVAVPAGGGEPAMLFEGPDFVANPRISPDGRWLSWLSWDHPNMPWDTSRLCAAPLWNHAEELRIGNVQVVAGGDDVSINSPDWTKDGRLVFSTDVTGFWNLQSWRPGDHDTAVLTTLDDREIGAPQWVFGTQQWAELDDGRLAVVITHDAVDTLACLDNSGDLVAIEADVVMVAGLAGGDAEVTVVGHAPDALPSVMTLAIESGSAPTVIRPPADLGVDTRWFSRAEAFDFDSNGRLAHAFFYPPCGPDLAGIDGELPPLVVMGHGGPTAHSAPDLSLKVQYWTSRGVAVVDVNYGGSSGFGRAYRNLLQDNWGIVDVEDCIAAAAQLAAAGKVDPDRIVIRGGSAGGFTVLSALEQADLFAAGTSLYGVADLEALATDTHKFESRYLDGLIGPYPAAREVYLERSPINHTDQLSSPLLVLQGSEDEIVPPNQSEAIVAAVAAKGLPHAYMLFEGEQHGFRQAATIVRSLEAELWFYGRVLGFEPADALEPIAGAVGLT